MVTTLSLDPNAGTLKELDSVSALPADTKLVPGAPRGGPLVMSREEGKDVLFLLRR